MKIRNFFVVALAALAVAACSKDVEGPANNKGGDIYEGTDGEAWIALTLSNKAQGTRNYHAPNQDLGTPVESEVKSAVFIFFDDTQKANAKVTAVKTLSMGANDELGAPGVAGKAFKIPASSKTIMVVVNPSAEFVTPAINDPFTNVNKAIAASADASTIANDPNSGTGFMMTNASGNLEPTIEVSTDNWQVTPLTLYTQASAANSNPLTIRVDRVAAKVRVYVGAATDNTNATISDAGWLLNAKNTRYIPMSQRTFTQNELTPKSGSVTWAPNDTYHWGSYRIDPNYETAQQSGSEYWYLTTPGNEPADNAWQATGAAMYCLENTQDAANNIHEYTTHVVIKAKFMPKAYAIPGGSNVTAQTAKEDWIMFNGNFFTYPTYLLWLGEELKAKYISSNGTTPNTADVVATYVAPHANALNVYLEEVLGAAAKVVLPAQVASVAELNTIIDRFNRQADVEAEAGRALSVYNDSFTYYAGGFNYYPVMIKHDDVTSDEAAWVNALGEFGVVRNSVYDVHVSKINNPGLPTIPPPSKTPDEELDKWLSIKIEINPWTWYEQNEIL